MRPSSIALLLGLALAPPVPAEKVSFEDVRFSLEFPAGWNKAEGPDNGNILYREAPGGDGSFEVFKLKVAKDRRADLKGILENRVEAIAKSGLTVTGEVEGQQQDFDGKPAVFGVIPVEAGVAGKKVRFRYYLVLIDARDMVVIMQATLPRPLPEKLRKETLGIIQSFRERE